jgi:Protein of unknown function (DUF4236)
MPWYFRRSFGRGPFRLNFSTRGVGASVGARGFRLGTGPRGAYVRAGRGGFYYQQYLRAPSLREPRRSPSRPHARPAPGFSPYAPSTGPTVLGKPVEFVGELEQNTDSFIADLNRRRQQLRWSTAAFVVVAVASFAALANGAAAPWYILVAIALIGSIVLRHRENTERAIIIMYELKDEAAERYAAFCAAFQNAASSAMIWRLATELALSEGRRHAGATKLITRTPTRIGFGSGRDVTTNVQPPVIELTNARIYLLPDKILLIAGNRVFSVPYSELRLGVEQDNFREDGPVPTDATLVGTTWQFVNKNGTPDRRFNNNRQIPIVAYSELTVKHAAFSFILQFSKQQIAARAAAALKLLAEG